MVNNTRGVRRTTRGKDWAMKATMLGLVCLGIWLLASTPATARGPHHGHHHGHGHGGGGGWRASVFVGGGYPAYRPYWGPVYYPAPAYYYPAPAYPVYPAPVAVAPVAPVVAPSFSFSFGR
jgi:hypothetical protein